MKNVKVRAIRFSAILFMAAVMMLLTAGSVSAAQKVEWVQRNGNQYIYMNGKMKKGWEKVGKKRYYFNSKGEQQVGWQEIRGKIYYFRIRYGKKGYMLKNTKVSGIRLKKNGQAVVTSSNRRKLEVLLEYQSVVGRMFTPLASKISKLRGAYDYLLGLTESTMSDYYSGNTNWHADYASVALHSSIADCYVRGTSMGYFANAIGYSNVRICENGHCWTDIGGVIYDPSYEYNYPGNNYFGVPQAALPAWIPHSSFKF